MRRLDLVADCGSCAAVCCVVLPFDASEDFAFDKPAGVPCHHLRADARCAVHDDLEARGLSGCAVFDCYGAGPRVTRTFADPHRRAEAFLVLREVHELLWLLTEAAKICPSTHHALARELAAAIASLDILTERDEVQSQRVRAHALLRRVGDALGGRQRVRPGPVVIE